MNEIKIGLVGCSKTKLSTPAPARHLYQGQLFKKSAIYCEMVYDGLIILSAKYGALYPETVVAPYDVTITDMNAKQAQEWAIKTAGQLESMCNENTIFFIHAGKRYQIIEEHLHRCVVVATPTGGIGSKLKWYNQQINLKRMNSK